MITANEALEIAKKAETSKIEEMIIPQVESIITANAMGGDFMVSLSISTLGGPRTKNRVIEILNKNGYLTSEDGDEETVTIYWE